MEDMIFLSVVNMWSVIYLDIFAVNCLGYCVSCWLSDWLLRLLLAVLVITFAVLVTADMLLIVSVIASLSKKWLLRLLLAV